MLHDLRYAVRMMAKDRWFTGVAVVALALGIGVNATVFTLVNAVLIRGLPFPESDRLFMVASQTTAGSQTRVSYADLLDWRSRSQTFEGLAAMTNASFNLSDDVAFPEQADGTRLTANTFGLLRQPPLIGRDFQATDEEPGAPPVVILGHELWTNRFGADPGAIGRTLRLNGEAATIVGVMPEGVKFPTNAELWTAFAPAERQRERDWRGLMVFGRLAPTATREAAETEMSAIAASLSTEYPETNEAYPAALIETFNDRFNGGPIRIVFLAMLGAVGFVLLIVCANVANLLLSRSARRAREIAVRVALGATRRRVIRQLLVESVLLGVLGGVVALLLAVAGVRLFDLAVADVGKPYWIDFRMDLIVFGYLAAVCVATGVVFGLVPALQVSRTHVTEILNESGRGSTASRRARWLSSTMVVAELALTIVLLVGAGLMVRSFLNMYTLDLGMPTERLTTMQLVLPSANYPTPDARLAFADELVPRLEALPGVERVALTTSVPPFDADSRGFEIEGRPVAPDTARPQTSVVTISPAFFDTVGVTLQRGRPFTTIDGAPGAEAVIVNERFAAEFFPDEEPIGRRIRFPSGADDPRVWQVIVAISPTIRHNSPMDSGPDAVAYVPYRRSPTAFVRLVVRSEVPPETLGGAVRSEVQAVDPDQPVFSIQTIDEALVQERWPFRIFGSLFAIFAVMGLLVSAVGLYAVMAYAVTQRTQEIGMRMALGADARKVSWLILRRGLVQIAIGLALGLTGAYFIATAIGALLVQVTPRDPVTFTAIAVLLTIVALAACLIPARRATRLDPLSALREPT